MPAAGVPDAAAASIRKGPIVAALIIGAFVSLLNQTLINVALPTISADLSIEPSTAQWLTTGFMLVNGILVPLSAYLVGRFTTRLLFLVSMILFSIGTVICALSGQFPVLMAGRIVQAAGAGVLMPLMNVIFLSIFPVEKRGQAMGLMGIAMIFAPAVGPTLSGWVVQHYDWQVLFYIVLPIAIASLLLGAFTMKNVLPRREVKLDYLGVVLSTLGFGGLLYGFSEAGTKGWDSSLVLAMLAIGAVSLVLLVLRQLSIKTPILEFRVFKFNMYALTTVINILVTMSMFGAMILLPLYLQNILGFTPIKAGLLLLPGAILMGIMSPITGMIFDRVGARWLAVTGLVITVVTTFEFSQLTDSTSYQVLILLYTARMFGMSLLMMPIMTAGLNQLPRELLAHGTAMSNTLRTVGGALGTALLVSIMSSQAKQQGADMIRQAGIDPSDAANKAAVAHITQEAYIHGINSAFLLATWISAAALVLAFFIRKTSPQEAVVQSVPAAAVAGHAPTEGKLEG
ncbi:DHA2 family efflux MFS transporter permease subunit [Paenibacillus pasadenensis]|uniref:Membrane component of multidrug resistance system n=1 Tax=Paenibacillus pasadenensis TaxID=217090 RepID=A0A2N5NAN5_9BACL|nr:MULTISPECIES: DHA2 family efflux MFS transporter permease subunit [Paenibacillus]PLT47383.1 Membrane component of multidrug resistance system [Paenibacillus pasadenensis]QGG58876.1 DHA2 family efflux MFS transporter permease subunit [Paenibacillus sp. B01]